MTEKSDIVFGENYAHSLKGYGGTWKKLILAMIAYAISVVLVTAVLIVGAGLLASVLGYGKLYWPAIASREFEKFPYGEKIYDIILFSLFPAGILANRLVFKSKAGELMSVAGCVRWK